MLSTQIIERFAAEEGFSLCAVVRAEPLTPNDHYFKEWLSEGYGAPLDYLNNYQELRFDPSKIVEGGRSVIVCAVNYRGSDAETEQARASGVGIASYALMRDYHKTIRKALKRLLKRLTECYPTLQGRVFTDSAPLSEKALAVRAGFGWIGRQSLLINPTYGSYMLLGEIVVDQDVDRYNDTEVESKCRGCQLCIESCPVGAINENRTIDTRLCIACRTIEQSDPGDDSMAGWIFGCDACQSCCPHNSKPKEPISKDMQRVITPPSIKEWQSMTQQQFENFAQGTPLRRSSLARILRCIYLNDTI